MEDQRPQPVDAQNQRDAGLATHRVELFSQFWTFGTESNL
jgi:hypothetical protein